VSEPGAILVDDDAAVRDSISLLLETAGIAVRAFASGEAMLAALQPDWQGCVVLDMNLKGMDGLAVQAELVRREAGLPVIFLTAYGDIPTTVRAMKGGATEFLSKPVDGEHLLALIRAALARCRPAAAEDPAAAAEKGYLEKLSPREMEVLKLALAGSSNKDIARQLSISHRTVEVHRSHILSKTRAASLLELANILAPVPFRTDRRG
jgi:FixJ family two-component response regulator